MYLISFSVFLNLRIPEIHLFYNLQDFYWHFLEILWLFIFLFLYSLYPSLPAFVFGPLTAHRSSQNTKTGKDGGMVSFVYSSLTLLRTSSSLPLPASLSVSLFLAGVYSLHITLPPSIVASLSVVSLCVVHHSFPPILPRLFSTRGPKRWVGRNRRRRPLTTSQTIKPSIALCLIVWSLLMVFSLPQTHTRHRN